MSEQVKINPDLSIILVGSVINKFISEYEGDMPDNRATIPVQNFITELNDTTYKYTRDFPNDEINFPQIDIKLLSFIINRTLYFKFVSVTNDEVVVEVGDKYENYLKNIVATSTFRYSKFLLNGAKQLYQLEKESVNGSEDVIEDANGNGEVIETTEEVKENAEPTYEANAEEVPTEGDVESPQQQSTEKESEGDNIEEEVRDESNEREGKESELVEEVELASPEIEELSQVEGNTSGHMGSVEKESKDSSQSNKEQTGSGESKEKLDENDEKDDDISKTILESQDVSTKENEDRESEDENEGKDPLELVEPVTEINKDADAQIEEKSPSTAEEASINVEDSSKIKETKDIAEPKDEQEGNTSDEDAEQDKSAVDESASPEPAASKEPSEEKTIEIIQSEPEATMQSKSEVQSRKRPRSRSPAPSQHHKRFQNIAVNLISSIQEHRFSSPFLQAVNPKDAPNYYEMIYQPKDLKSISKALKSKNDPPAYSSIKELERDVMLMFANCIMYNRPDEDLVDLTRTMKKDVGDMFKMFKEAESEMK
ncbi:hypothetical protein CANMA_000719 [Candida margitis]|uniref:uncharacterized protein n=1 Tax=Candida margitis TaxID=1775924 RepID=UPI0022261D64|nr:uncharacterized protein CANMA_000719 [Candida margitis]KAI5970108.1 hypothetical protein CANMA_000719 [Candida margitis]